MDTHSKDSAFHRLYAIVDPALLQSSGTPLAFADFVRELLLGGVQLVQYRSKHEDNRLRLSQAREMTQIRDSIKQQSGRSATLIMNDRPDLCEAAGMDGVHVGQNDISPRGARKVLAAGRLLGLSTHDLDQIRIADGEPVDYLAIGPVFATASKANPDPVVGLEGVRQARRQTTKPLVAIGGITPQNCSAVIEAGADAVAVISSLIREPRKSVEEFLRILR